MKVVVLSDHYGSIFPKIVISYNESHVPIVDEEGEIRVKKKQYTFQRKKWKVCHFESSILGIEKLLFEKFVCNVSVVLCCP